MSIINLVILITNTNKGTDMAGKTPEVIAATKARQNFGDLLSRANIAQEEFIIERDGKQLAMLVPIKPETSAPQQEEGPQQENDVKAAISSTFDVVNRLDFRNSAGICKALWGSVLGEADKSSVTEKKTEVKFPFKRGDSIFIDADPIIYYWAENAVYFGVMEEIFNSIYQNNVQCFFSALTLIRSIINQTEKQEFSLTKKCSTFLNSSSNFNYHKIDGSDSALIAKVKSDYKDLNIDESIQLGSALSIGADYFLTNNSVYKLLPKRIVGYEINIIILDDLIKCQPPVVDLPVA
ncbi:MAG: hypothetical protein PHI06_11795 [Desulfobulbaceae bacterium]|nr:hypothetical protein [Desulfobulbaceae bacterium]